MTSDGVHLNMAAQRVMISHLLQLPGRRTGLKPAPTGQLSFLAWSNDNSTSTASKTPGNSPENNNTKPEKELTVPPITSYNQTLDKCDLMDLDFESWINSDIPEDPEKTNLENLAAEMKAIGIDPDGVDI